MTEKEFITSRAGKLWSDSIKKFPVDFLPLCSTRKIELPGKALVIGEEFFGSFEILTVQGNPVLHAASHDEAKFIIYSNRDKLNLLEIPEKHEEIKSANTKYEYYLDSIIKNIEEDYRNTFPGSKNSNVVVNEIFRALNLIRY